MRRNVTRMTFLELCRLRFQKNHDSDSYLYTFSISRNLPFRQTLENKYEPRSSRQRGLPPSLTIDQMHVCGANNTVESLVVSS